MPISEIAYESGFETFSNFNKVFKNTFRISIEPNHQLVELYR